MVGGELTDVEKRRVNVTIAEVEAITGLEFCVLLRSDVAVDGRQAAERFFHRLGLHERPAVMILVSPPARALEVVTAPELSSRLSDEHCRTAVEIMTELFAAGDLCGGLEQGLLALAELVGPRSDGSMGHKGGEDIPNVVDLDNSDD